MIYASPNEKTDMYTKMLLCFPKSTGDVWKSFFMEWDTQFPVIKEAPGRVP